MSKLYPRALVKYENAMNSYKKLGVDDAYVDDCCYNLQQTLELLLKYMVEMRGNRYAENHDVRAQLNKLSSAGIALPCFDKIRNMASTINSWEAESRYLDSFVATIEDIDDVRNIVEELLEYCKTLAIEIQTGDVIS